MESRRAKFSKTKTSDPILADLMPEIFKASDVETLARFLCVSKEYKSIIRNRDFMKSYLIKSSTRPQNLMFTFGGRCSRMYFFFSASHPKSRGDSSSSSSSLATYHMKCRSHSFTTVGISVHGLICYGPPWNFMVYNPSTRKTITLPNTDDHYRKIDMHHYLGYDPIDGDYKVLCVVKDDDLALKLQVLTLGNGNSWRTIKKFPRHYLRTSPNICIDGVLYYVALLTDKSDSHAVISFDVRSEKLRLIKGLDHAFCPKLTKYEGKLAVLFSTNCYQVRIHLWVLENAAKHEWSKKFYVLHDIDIRIYCCFHPFCATDAGEIVLAPFYIELAKPFHVLYYHPKKNSVRRVYIEGITGLTDPCWDEDLEHNTISISSGQVDNLMFL